MSTSKFSPEQIRARAAARSAAREETNTAIKGSSIFTDSATIGESSPAVVVEETTEQQQPSTSENTQDPASKEIASTQVREEVRVQVEADNTITQASKLLSAMQEAGKEPKWTGEQGSGITSIMDQLEEKVEPPVIQEDVQVHLESKPSLADTSVFQKLTTTSEGTGIDGGDSYAELVENLISSQCQMSGVKNLDLTTFGLRAQVLTFPNLSVMEYGVHKFLGAPFTEEEENMIIHRLGLHVAQSDKSKIVVRAVQEVTDTRGMSFYSLLFNNKIAQRFADMFNYTVHANLKESDVSKLVLVIQK